MTTLYIVRHGQSMGNIQGIMTGQTDVKLSELGKKQATVTAEYLKNIHFDTAYSSDLSRAYETAQEILKYHGNIEISLDKRLREIDVGDWEGELYDELPKIYPVEYGIWLSDISKSCPLNGESPLAAYDRINSVIDEIARANEGKTVLIASHAMALKCLATRVLYNDASRLKDTKWSTNSSVSVFTYDLGKYELVEYSHDSHLGDMTTALPKTC